MIGANPQVATQFVRVITATQNQVHCICNYLVEQRDEGIADGILVGEDSGCLASGLGGEPLEAGEEGGKFDEGLIGLGLHRAIQFYSFGQRFVVQIIKFRGFLNV